MATMVPFAPKPKDAEGRSFLRPSKTFWGSVSNLGAGKFPRFTAPTRKQGRNAENWNDKWINVTLSFQLSKNGNPGPLSQLIEWNWNPDPKWGGFCFLFLIAGRWKMMEHVFCFSLGVVSLQFAAFWTLNLLVHLVSTYVQPFETKT